MKRTVKNIEEKEKKIKATVETKLTVSRELFQTIYFQRWVEVFLTPMREELINKIKSETDEKIRWDLIGQLKIVDKLRNYEQLLNDLDVEFQLYIGATR
jgi:hypothetical protein